MCGRSLDSTENVLLIVIIKRNVNLTKINAMVEQQMSRFVANR